jgi:hypothetical protein
MSNWSEVLVTEEGDAETLHPADAALLEQRGLIDYCPLCEEYHHAEFARWDEIREVLRDLADARRVLFRQLVATSR